jgi:biopolymer transport protein TolR
MTGDVRRRITSDGAIAGVNIVPVIDLCLVLLVVLMIVSPMLDAPPVEVNLPQALFEDSSERATITVSLDTAGNIAVNDKRLENKELLGPYLKEVATREQRVEPIVVLRTDKDTAYGLLTEIIALLKEVGFEDIALATHPLKDELNAPGEGS